MPALGLAAMALSRPCHRPTSMDASMASLCRLAMPSCRLAVSRSWRTMPTAMPCRRAMASAVALAVLWRIVAVTSSVATVSVLVGMATTMASMASVAVHYDRVLDLLQLVDMCEMAHVVGADVKKLVHADAATDGWHYFGKFVDVADAILHFNRVFCRDQI